MIYSSRYLGPGTRSAGPCLSPMFDAWGASKGISLYPGTLNLCADDAVVVPNEFESLDEVKHLVIPEWRQFQTGFSPRLYPVLLNSSEVAWLFRWSEQDFLKCFVGNSDNCLPEHRCEIISTKQLTAELRLKPGAAVRLEFAGR
jgi:CTP-dependent riboflavin kinase